jgi:hypothetical protein
MKLTLTEVLSEIVADGRTSVRMRRGAFGPEFELKRGACYLNCALRPSEIELPDADERLAALLRRVGEMLFFQVEGIPLSEVDAKSDLSVSDLVNRSTQSRTEPEAK